MPGTLRASDMSESESSSSTSGQNSVEGLPPVSHMSWAQGKGRAKHCKQNGALIKAAKAGRLVACWQLSFGQGCDVDALDEQGYTALMYAAEAGHVRTALALLAMGAAIYVEGAHLERSAIHCAAAAGEDECLHVLLEAFHLCKNRRAEINRPDVNGTTPLALAARHNGESCAAAFLTLLKQGAEYSSDGDQDGGLWLHRRCRSQSPASSLDQLKSLSPKCSPSPTGLSRRRPRRLPPLLSLEESLSSLPERRQSVPMTNVSPLVTLSKRSRSVPPLAVEQPPSKMIPQIRLPQSPSTREVHTVAFSTNVRVSPRSVLVQEEVPATPIRAGLFRPCGQSVVPQSPCAPATSHVVSPKTPRSGRWLLAGHELA